MWFDSERMAGAIVDQMIKGIDESDLVIVFITKKYCQKVASGNPKDNCRKEFMYTSQNKGATKMIPIPMEPCMMNPLSWVGVVNMELGGLLYEASFPTDDDVKFEENIDNLFKQIVRETSASIPQQKSGSTGSSRAAVTTENPQVSQEAATSKSATSTQIDPLSDDLISFLTTAKVKVSDQLTIAFNELGFASIDDFDDLDEEMTASLEVAMKPLEVKRFRKSLIAKGKETTEKAAREKAAALELAAKKVRLKFKIGQAVTWTSSDNDVPEGTVGVVTSQCDDGVSANVKFCDGSWKFNYTQLRISSKKPTVSFFVLFFLFYVFFNLFLRYLTIFFLVCFCSFFFFRSRVRCVFNRV